MCLSTGVCGKIFWQARGTGFQPVEFDTGKMPVPRWRPSARESCHTPTGLSSFGNPVVVGGSPADFLALRRVCG